jgi:hypothetical protein
VPKENVMEKPAFRIALVKYDLSVGGEVYKGLTESEVRVKLAEIDPEGKLKATDFRVRESKS